MDTPSLVVDLVSVTRGVDNVEPELDTILNNDWNTKLAINLEDVNVELKEQKRLTSNRGDDKGFA